MTLTTEQLSQIMLNTIRSMSEEQKAEIRRALNKELLGFPFSDDVDFLRRCGIALLGE